MIQELAFTARFCCSTKVFFHSVKESDHRPGGGGGGCFTSIAIGRYIAHFYISIGLTNQLTNQHGIKVLGGPRRRVGKVAVFQRS